jgi:putative DNA primase/helicase
VADFSMAAAAALACCRDLLPQWLPGGKFVGHEYLAAPTSTGGLGDSLSINTTTGLWSHFSTGDKGGDLISLYAYLNKISQSQALHALSGQLNLNGSGSSLKRATGIHPSLAEPIPEDAHDPPELPNQIETYWYTDRDGVCLFVIARCLLTDGHKSFKPWTWRNNSWQQKSWPAPRPLYNLIGVYTNPQSDILVVEGEKCADAAVCAGYVAVTWSHGAQSYDKTDWGSLKDRNVIIWPDADEAGKTAALKIAAKLSSLCTTVRVLDIDDKPEGWDIADLISEHGDVAAFITGHQRQIGAPRPALSVVAVRTAEPKTDCALVTWQSLGLQCNHNGIPHATLANASLILQQHPMLHKKIYYDSFRDKIYTSRSGVSREWRDCDDRDLTVWIQQHLLLDKIQLKLVQQAVLHCAYLDQRNSFQNWVTSIQWDRVERRYDWLTDCLGCEGTEHHRTAGSNWLISMVARGFNPGCKADHMPVLEGLSSLGKSSALEILGGKDDPDGNDWYAAVSTEFGSKQFLENIQGRILVEIPDMAGFGKAAHAKIIGTLSTRVDPYRVPWDRYSSDHPRRCIFAATSESADYLEYPDGKRRYWPIRCLELNKDLLREMRPQLFAEAHHVYREGATWHEMPLTTVSEQTERISEDVWHTRIDDYLSGRLVNQTSILERVHSSELLEAVGVPLKDQHDGLKRRIKKIMEMLGWEQKVDSIQGRSVKRWRQKI